MKQVDYSLSLFNCKIRKKKLIGKADRYIYLFEEFLVVNHNVKKEKPHRLIEYADIKQVIWNYASDKKQIFLKSFIVDSREKLKYYAPEDILIALKRIIAKFVFQARVQDEYTNQEILGEGSYALVVQLTHIHSGFPFAGKCIEKKKISQIENGLKSVSNEIKIMRTLSPHSQIVNLHEVYEGDSNIYLIMDLCKGGNLQAEIKDKRLPKESIRQIMSCLLSAIEYVHSKGVMHRDLKPENILFQQAGDYSTLKIADFGLSTFQKDSPYLYSKCGTPGYVAPEVANLVDKSQGYSLVCDIFSIGAIFHLLLTGEGVFPGKGHAELLKLNKICDINLDLYKFTPEEKDLLQNMLTRHPEKRPTAFQCLEHPYFDENKELTFREQKAQSFVDFQSETSLHVAEIYHKPIEQRNPSILSFDKEKYLDEDDQQ